MNDTFIKWKEINQRSPWVSVLALFALSLIPFCGKAIHLDDPIFLWTAQQIQANPLNPYGAEVNWDGWDTALHWINLNPPLSSYYLAIWGSIFGYHEVVLHLAYLLPALLLALGVYRLAEKVCRRPQEAALFCLWSPVLMLSATTLMCDITMLCFWCWAILFFIEAAERRHLHLYLISGILISLSALSKYFGICLVPLLIAYALVKKAHLGRTIMAMAIPLATMALYFEVTEKMYGHSLIDHAGAFSTFHRSLADHRIWVQLLKGLVFSGGCCVGILFYLRRIWTVRSIAATAIVVIGLWWSLDYSGHAETFSKDVAADLTARILFWIQMVVFMVAGLGLLTLLPLKEIPAKHPETILLILWILGTLVFSLFINWTINGRTIMGIAVPLGLLLFRKLDTKGPPEPHAFTRFAPLAVILALSLLICQADYMWASSTRTAARDIATRFARPNRSIWFHGHWGFQWYLEELDAKAVDVSKSVLEAGDVWIVAHDNSMPWRKPEIGNIVLADEQFVPIGLGCGIMKRKMGAGFYSALWGPMPFAFGPVPKDHYQVYQVLDRLQINKNPH